MFDSASVMLILYSKDSSVPFSDIVSSLSEIPGLHIEEVANSHLIATEDSWPIDIFVNDSPHVLTESRDLAQRFSTRSDNSFIAASDRRIEVSYPVDPQMEHFNTWLLITDKLAHLVHGMIYDTASSTFPRMNA